MKEESTDETSTLRQLYYFYLHIKSEKWNIYSKRREAHHELGPLQKEKLSQQSLSTEEDTEGNRVGSRKVIRLVKTEKEKKM